MQVETSKALAVVERGVPTTNEITVFQPGTYPQQADLPRAQEPYPRVSRFHAQDTPIELRTVVPRNTLVIRVAVDRGRYRRDRGGGPALGPLDRRGRRSTRARRSAIPAPRPPKPVEVQPIVAAAPSPSAAARAAARGCAASLPRSRRRRSADAAGARALPAEATKSARPSSPAEPTPRRPHGSSTHAERHHAPASSEAPTAGTAKPDEGAKPEQARQADPGKATGRGRSRRHDGAHDRVIGRVDFGRLPARACG